MKFTKLVKADEQDQVKILEDNLSKLHGVIEAIKMGNYQVSSYWENKEEEIEEDLADLNLKIKFFIDKFNK